LSTESLTELRDLTVPTLANAVELFGVVQPNEGYNRRPVTCHFPEFGMCAGFAVTVAARTDSPAAAMDEPKYWSWLETQPGPKIVVVQDLDDPPGGAMWGEWNANVHRALGCVGTITEGAVRDLDALDRLGFHAFATSVSVAHGYGVFVDYGMPVEVAGLRIATGDLVVADQHGVLRIPGEIPIDELCTVARRIDELESEIFAYCGGEGFNVDGLAALQESVLARWPRPRSLKGSKRHSSK
jgi:4-hydroxy-4-methyl-2-oxoglutarate aldolase